MLTKEAMFDLVKEAGKIVHSCGHESRCRCSSNHTTHYDIPCWDCRKKEAAEIVREDENNENRTTGQKVIDTAKAVGEKAVAAGAMAVGGLASLGKPTPPLKVNDRY